MPKKISDVRKIGVISDTHIPTRAAQLPASVHDRFKSVDLIIFCGDAVSPDVIAELETIAPVYAVRGNMDGPDIKEPSEQELLINNKFTLCVSHGSGSPLDIKERLYQKFLQYRPYMIIFGHTHFPETAKYHDVIFFNPGSCTQGSDHDSIGMLEIGPDSIDCKIIRL